MTVATTKASTGPLFGNGANVVFPFDFEAPSASEISVTVGGVEVATSAYSVSLNPDNTGDVTFTSAPVDGAEVYILSAPTFLQQAELQEYGQHDWADLNPILDRLARYIIALRGTASRAITVPFGETGIETDASSDRDGGFARFVEGRLAAVSAAELAVILDPEKQAGTTLAYSALTGPRSQAVVFDPAGVGEGGYWIEFSAQANTDFVRAYARVFAGSGSCDIRVLAGGAVVWSSVSVTSAEVDEAISQTLEAGDDLIVVIENITGDVTGVVVKLEGSAS